MDSGTIEDIGQIEQAFTNIRGKVWECNKNELNANTLRNSIVCNTKVNNEGQQIVRIINEAQPVPSATSVCGTLEDLYLYFVGGK